MQLVQTPLKDLYFPAAQIVKGQALELAGEEEPDAQAEHEVSPAPE